MSKPEKLAVGIVTSKYGFDGMKSWKPVATNLTMAEAEALSDVLVEVARMYIHASRKEQVLLAEFKRIWKEAK